MSDRAEPLRYSLVTWGLLPWKKYAQDPEVMRILETYKASAGIEPGRIGKPLE